MELFWKLALMPASFDPPDQFVIELLIAFRFPLQLLIFERMRVEPVEFRLGFSNRVFEHRFPVLRLRVFHIDALLNVPPGLSSSR